MHNIYIVMYYIIFYDSYLSWYISLICVYTVCVFKYLQHAWKNSKNE